MKKTAGLLFVIVFPIWIYAQQGMLPHIICGPYLQAVGENEFTLQWISDIDAIATVEVAANNGIPFETIEKSLIHENIHGRKPITMHHKIRVSGLKKGASYRYRIVMQAAISDNKEITNFGQSVTDQIYTVKLLNHDKEEIFFAVTNDVHERTEDLRMMFKDARQKNMILYYLMEI